MPEWTNGADCKSVFRGFESRSGLYPFRPCTQQSLNILCGYTLCHRLAWIVSCGVRLFPVSSPARHRLCPPLAGLPLLRMITIEEAQGLRNTCATSLAIDATALNDETFPVKPAAKPILSGSGNLRRWPTIFGRLPRLMPRNASQ